MTDLEGNDLEVGTIYVLPAKSSAFMIARYSHETSKSYIFDVVGHNKGVNDVWLYTWKRQLPKHTYYNNISIIKASQLLIDKYELK